MSHAGKYTLIEVDGEQDAEVKVNVNVHMKLRLEASSHEITRCYPGQTTEEELNGGLAVQCKEISVTVHVGIAGGQC